jgi:vesicle-fusing ATPase
MGVSVELKVDSSPGNALALTNQVFLNQQEVNILNAGINAESVNQEKCYILLRDQVYTYRPHDKIPPGSIGLSNPQRQNLSAALNEKITGTLYIPDTNDIYLATMRLEVDFLAKNKKVTDRFEVDEIKKSILTQLEQQIFTVGQKFVLDCKGNNLVFKVLETQVMNISAIGGGKTEAEAATKAERGILVPHTDVTMEKAQGSQMLLSGGGSSGAPKIFKPDWKFESMGIGGLDKEFADIFRRAFASRIFPPAVVQKLGIQHVKGILLFGPPGTGKTLMARQIGKMLNGKEPKVVSGPEILNKYVGASEENIRNLFKEAEQEYKQRGEDSDLHIIIFDEFDAICRARGSRNDGTGVGDTVVNQLLAKIDGVDSLNNILIIGMTNRKELIDEALLRPGRMEVHMEISLPDEPGRVQIFRIHTTKMRDNNYMAEDVQLEELAALTKNYSGAEIEGVVKAATSYAFSRQIDAKNLTKPIDPEKIKVARADFLQALQEIKPAFGVEKDEFELSLRGGIINYSAQVEKLINTGRLFLEQVAKSDRTPLVSVLLSGTIGSGRTALAATLAKNSDFPFVRLLSPDTLVGYSEAAKCARITKVFEDSYRSQLSVIVVDDIERILEYVPIGPRFSNAILQTLLVLFKRLPPKGRKLLVIGTTSNEEVLRQMEFMECFSTTMRVPVIATREEFKKAIVGLELLSKPEDVELAAQAFTAESITIKKLIMLTELAKQGPPERLLDRLVTILTEYSLGS